MFQGSAEMNAKSMGPEINVFYFFRLRAVNLFLKVWIFWHLLFGAMAASTNSNG